VKNIGLVNIVAGKRIVPELVQQESTPENMADALTTLLSDPIHLQQIRTELIGMRARLGDSGASARAASVVREFLAG
jgi:lipid-A-disaccharide synthase